MANIGLRDIMLIMGEHDQYEYFLIREDQVLVRLCRSGEPSGEPVPAELFDVRTGVRLKEIHPPFNVEELQRGNELAANQAEVIMKSGMLAVSDTTIDFSKVVSILELKQRRLDSVVAESILDQVRVVRDILQDLLNVAASSRPEERFWLSQQVLSLLPKFSGRELTELREILDWMKKRPRKT